MVDNEQMKEDMNMRQVEGQEAEEVTEEAREVAEQQVEVHSSEDQAVEDTMPQQDVEVQPVRESVADEGEENAAESMTEAMKNVDEIHIGDVVEGEVLAIDDNKQAIVGLGGGQEGVIPQNELSAAPFENVTDIVNVGDTIELVVIKEVKDKEQGSYLLSKRRIDARKVWDELQEKFEAGEKIEAPVTNVVKGGLVVDTGVRGFVPASLFDVRYIEDFSPYKGETFTYKIIEIEPSENRLILSRKAVLEEELEAKKEEIFNELEEGQTVTGTVARLTDFGAFIDLGGVDGLVHISQIAHEHVDHPSDKLTPGEEIEVRVLSVDKERERISLSIKDTLPGPWEGIEERVQKDDVVDGTVKRLTSFGAFVEVFPGVEGLVHISQISHNHIATPHEVLTPGDEIQVKVLDVKPEEERLSLSIKALEEKPEREERQPRENRSRSTQSSSSDDSSDTGFTLGDLLGDRLSDITGEDSDDNE